MTDKSKTAGIIIVAAVFFIIDRLLKRAFFDFWQTADINMIGGWADLRLATNPGIAFGLPFGSTAIIILTGLISVMLVYAALICLRRREWLEFFSLAFVIAGAFSNLLDRLASGAVIDYIYVRYFSIFNLADVMITCGIIALIAASFWRRRRRKTPSADLN